MTETLGAEAIIEKFGLKHDMRFECVTNSILNFTRIVMNQNQGEPPKIYYHEHSYHAYIFFEGHVLNGGVTAEKGWYPNFSIDELKADGSDQTINFLVFTLSSEFMRQRMQLVFPDSTLAIAIPKLQQIFLQLTQH